MQQKDGILSNNLAFMVSKYIIQKTDLVQETIIIEVVQMVQSQGGSLVLFFSFFYKGGSYLLGFRNMKMHLLIQICFYGKNINKLVIEFHFKIFKIIFIIIAISIYYPFSISGFGIDRYVRLGCIPQFFSSMSSLDSIDLQFIQA